MEAGGRGVRRMAKASAARAWVGGILIRKCGVLEGSKGSKSDGTWQQCSACSLAAGKAIDSSSSGLQLLPICRVQSF